MNHCLIWSIIVSFKSGPSVSRILSRMVTNACWNSCSWTSCCLRRSSSVRCANVCGMFLGFGSGGGIWPHGKDMSCIPYQRNGLKQTIVVNNCHKICSCSTKFVTATDKWTPISPSSVSYVLLSLSLFFSLSLIPPPPAGYIQTELYECLSYIKHMSIVHKIYPHTLSLPFQ